MSQSPDRIDDAVITLLEADRRRIAFVEADFEERNVLKRRLEISVCEQQVSTFADLQKRLTIRSTIAELEARFAVVKTDEKSNVEIENAPLREPATLKNLQPASLIITLPLFLPPFLWPGLLGRQL